MEKQALLEKLKAECLECRRCDIGGRKMKGDDREFLSNVFSNMCMKAQIMVVGQNPGVREVAEEMPFVGPSGNFFDDAIKRVLGIDRTLFYITNTVHCFSPNNRKPKIGEVLNCQYFLDREVKIVNPKVIVTLGAPAFEQITGRHGIMKWQGEIMTSPRYLKPVLPLLHPSPLNMNKQEKREMFYKGLEKLKEFLRDDSE